MEKQYKINHLFNFFYNYFFIEKQPDVQAELFRIKLEGETLPFLIKLS